MDDKGRSEMVGKARGVLVLLAFVLVIGGVAWNALSGDDAPKGAVSRSSLGSDWPLTTDSGVLHCDNSAVTYTDDDTNVTYAVNGFADSRAGAEGWSDIRQIWADDPSGVQAKKSIGPLIDKGEALC